MFTDAELLEFVPSNQKNVLAASVGRRLTDVERLFALNQKTFLKYNKERFNAADFFSHNVGAVQLHFEGHLTHVLDVYGEQLSVVVMPVTLSSNGLATLYRLTEIEPVPSALRACLGETCQDVRIWTLKEDFESEEVKEVAVSYLFSNDLELFYCIYLHDDLDSDYLLVKPEVPREKVATCFSLADGEYIVPNGKHIVSKSMP